MRPPGVSAELTIYPDSGHVVAVLANLDPPIASLVSEFICHRLPVAVALVVSGCGKKEEPKPVAPVKTINVVTTVAPIVAPPRLSASFRIA